MVYMDEQAGKMSEARSLFRKRTVGFLVSLAVIAVVVVILFMPVLQIFGDEMSPVLTDGSLVLSVKNPKLEDGDIVAFYHNNKILIKRVIATQGEFVDIDEDGAVYVNNRQLEEPYVTEKAEGDCTIDLPLQVPEAEIFVMGDHRSESVDSRNESIGCISKDKIVGKLVFCIWPLTNFGIVR